MKRTAIVYYSMSGNTEYVAKEVAEKTGGELIKLTPKKEYPSKGFAKFFWGGKSAVMGDTPSLEDYSFDAQNIDRIIFGTPVWAGSFTPPLRTFIKENKEALAGKEFAAFFCFSGGGADKAKNKLLNFLGADNFSSELILVDPKDKPSEEKAQMTEEFCKKLAE
ncbi:MAG: flavodoxin domain-containing protein [Clostridiales bacterium]|nr:flavodoxin domain-containing protein [Clostridiales bacterium]